MKQTILSQINSVVGGTLKHVKGGVYSMEAPDSQFRCHFRLSVMEKDGGVDAKYYLWGLQADTTPLVVAGKGALTVANRVKKSVEDFGNDPFFKIHTIEEFMDFLYERYV